MTRLITLGLALCIAVGSQAIAAADIVLDFSHANATLFDTNTTNGVLARAAVQQAANDISEALNATLAPLSPDINPSTNQYRVTGTGTVNLATATSTYDATYGYTNPTTNANEIFNPQSLGANEVRIFVGSQNLGGDTLGVGGPGGFQSGQAGLSSGGGFSQQDVDNAAAMAVADMNAQANAVFGRGGSSPVFGDASGSVGGNPYSINFNASLGNLWFDTDTNNVNGTDSAMELDDFWHFDANSATDPNKIDFYTVALHEMLHAIGIGTADSWTDLVSPFVDGMTSRDWLGPNAIALAGSGSDLIEPDAAHIEIGTTSLRLSDGMLQEVVMDPDIEFGQRKELTQLDIAFLQDIGWANANSSLQANAIPEPAIASLLGLTMVLLATRRRRV
ncbi:hypothetical protein N9L06_01845 [Mariniblastus sp.]|nr:hypothetical protein [Mariniblastus sp.]